MIRRVTRLPIEPLRQAIGATSNVELALRTGRERRSILRYQHDGLTLWSADKMAVRCGLHPAEVWPEWFGAEDVA